MERRRYTEEQINEANGIDLVDMLQKSGEQLKRQGIIHRWMKYDSTVIYKNKWYRHSRQTGGGPIQFMQHFYGMSFVDAVKHLLGGAEGARLIQADSAPYIKPEFKEPIFSKNMHRTFAYLVQTRKIDDDVVRHFVDAKKILETAEYHNAAFVGYDENGVMKQAHLRSTLSGKRFFMDAEGSDKQYYFRHIGTSDKVFVFEAPIDMLSFITLNKETWERHSYVCLGGVAADALRNVLKINPQINMVYMCVDNDEAGDKTAKRIGAELTEGGVAWERLTPQGKDWNDDLMRIKEQEENENFNMSYEGM
ncbi:MAG: DUF3991 and toprim domain-containing protein [Clostridia bacterium]|nr:DUF3991 and toprim domain-containing protein [Clostridia bacterium]